MTQRIELVIKNSENIGMLDEKQIAHIQEILVALITSGGLTGVKGGKTLIHFDNNGTFMGVELSYWPWRRRHENRERN